MVLNTLTLTLTLVSANNTRQTAIITDTQELRQITGVPKIL